MCWTKPYHNTLDTSIYLSWLLLLTWFWSGVLFQQLFINCFFSKLIAKPWFCKNKTTGMFLVIKNSYNILKRNKSFGRRIKNSYFPFYLPEGESLDLRAKDQLSGLTEAQWGNLNSTGWLNFNPWGPHITKGDNKVSPENINQSFIESTWKQSGEKSSTVLVIYFKALTII